MRDRTNKQLAEKLDIIKESFNENGSVFELLTIVQERLNSIPIEPPVKPANGDHKCAGCGEIIYYQNYCDNCRRLWES